jgi:D-alanine-D-alanine ligase
MNNDSRIRVAVLRGGPSQAYEDSLKTGAHILSILREMPESYDPIDIFIDRNGEWHERGLANDPHKILESAHVVWNALHGPYGEDGEVQRLLERLQMPFTGSSTLASAFTTNKDLSKSLYDRHSLLTPGYSVVSEDDFSDETLIAIFRTHLHPVIVKPSTGVRGLGVRIARTFQELKDAVKKTFEHSPKAIVEEYVRGHVVSCTVIEKAKGERLYALIPSGRLPTETNKQIEEMAKKAHEILGQRHYSSSDFIISPRGKVYILETNSLPVLHEGSHHHNSLLATGWQPKDFADHCIRLALGRVE